MRKSSMLNSSIPSDNRSLLNRHTERDGCYIRYISEYGTCCMTHDVWVSGTSEVDYPIHKPKDRLIKPSQLQRKNK